MVAFAIAGRYPRVDTVELSALNSLTSLLPRRHTGRKRDRTSI